MSTFILIQSESVLLSQLRSWSIFLRINIHDITTLQKPGVTVREAAGSLALSDATDHVFGV
jgi:hypothetical protein